MTIDTRTPEDRQRELWNIALLQAKKKVAEAQTELEWLILATPTGNERNILTEANIHIMEADAMLSQLKSKEKDT